MYELLNARAVLKQCVVDTNMCNVYEHINVYVYL
jgi:hypothetical protein